MSPQLERVTRYLTRLQLDRDPRRLETVLEHAAKEEMQLPETSSTACWAKRSRPRTRSG